MGLKGKIEAVIYAAEEPVTLAQLAALFGAEALAEMEPESTAAAPETEAPLLADSEVQIEAALLEEAPLEAEGSSSQADGFAPAEAAADEAKTQENYEEVEQKRLARTRDRKAREQLRVVLDELMAEYAQGDRGVEIQEIAGGYRVATKPEYHDAVRGFVKSLKPPMKLSLQALETLAVIAYKQPVTAPEIADIRGVDSGGVLGSLIGRKLVTTAGRKQVIGRPILYKTTREFLLRFGLKDLAELPSMEEFERMAGELEEEPAGQMLLAGDAQPSAEEAAEEEPAHERPQAEPSPIIVTDEDAEEASEAPEDPGVTIEPAVPTAQDEKPAPVHASEDNEEG